VRAVLGVAAILAWGDLALRLGGSSSAHRRLPERYALAWLAGCIVTSWLVFVALWVDVPLFPAVVGLGACGLAAWLIATWRRPTFDPAEHGGTAARRRPAALGMVFLGVIGAVVAEVALAALARPLTAWDAWVNWASKARVLVIDQGMTQSLYSDPSRLPTNLDYPLLLPISEAWLWTWAGTSDDVLVGLLSLLHTIALVATLWAALKRRVAVTPALGFTALLVTTPRFDLMAAAGLADLLLAALVVTALAMAADHTDSARGGCDQARAWILPAILCAGMPWLKNEGWVWWGVTVVALLGRFALPRRPADGRIPAAPWPTVPFLAVAFLPPALWQLFLALRGTERFAFFAPTPARMWAHIYRLPEIALEAVRHLLSPDWNLIWLLVAITVILRRRRALQGGSAAPIAGVAVFLAAISASFMFSRFDPYVEHVANSLDRLIWQALPVAVWWLAVQAAESGLVATAEPNVSA